MTDFKTATNPETGERVIEIDGQWKPLTEFKTATNPDSGEQAVNVNGAWARIPAVDVINTREGGSFKERAGAGMKITPQGRLAYVQSLVGEENVVQLPNGDIQFRRAPNETFRPFDERGPDIGDVADLPGIALETVPGLLATAGKTPAGRAGTAVGTMVRAGLADTGGNVARQAASAALPGDDQATLKDRAVSAGSAFAIGGAGQGLADKVMTPTMNAVNPKNVFVSKPVQRQQEKPFAIKGRRLAAQTGIPQTIGEETGARGVLIMEGVAREHPLGATRVANADSQKIQQAHQGLKRISESLAARTGEENAGRGVIKTFKNAREQAVTLRRETANRDFAIIDSVSGSEKILPVDNFIETLDGLIASSSSPLLGNTPARSALVKMRERIFEETALNPGATMRLTGREFQNTLHQLGRAAQGKGDFVKDLSANEQRDFARQLLKALENDMSRAADAPGFTGELSTALKAARDNYAENSGHITTLNESALGRLIGTKENKIPAPEVVAQKVNKLPLSEYREAVDFLSRTDPETLQIVKRAQLDEMLDQSYVTGSGKRADGGTFSPTKFNTQMLNPKKAAKLRTLYTRQEFVDMKRLSKAMERINDQIVNNSKSTVFAMAFDFMQKIAGGAFSIPGVANMTASLLSVRTFSNAMTDPVARQALIDLSQAKTVTQKSAQAAATVAGIVAFDAIEDAKRLSQERISTPRQVPGGL